MTFIAYPGDNLVIPLGKYTIRYITDNSKAGRYYDGVWLQGCEADQIEEFKVFIKDTEDIFYLREMLDKRLPKCGFFFQLDGIYTPPSSGWIHLYGVPNPVSLELL